MNYTNKFKLPEFVTEFLKVNEYDKTENMFSVTELLKPVRVFALMNLHSNELSIDVSELVSGRMGTAIHDCVENSCLTGCIHEQRLFTEINKKGVTGKFDILKAIDWEVTDNETGKKYIIPHPVKKELIDIKNTYTFVYINKSKDDEYVKQLSVYRYLCNLNKYNVIRKGMIWFFFNDWSATRASYTPNYPIAKTVIKEIDLWSMDETYKYLFERVNLFNRYEKDIEGLPLCSKEELWTEDDKFQVVKEGRKTAVKNCISQEEAELYIKQNTLKGNISVSVKKGKARRCKYCIVRRFCNQYKDMVKEGTCDEVEEVLLEEIENGK